MVGVSIKGKQASEDAYQPQTSLSRLLRTQAAHTKFAFRFAEAGVSREGQNAADLQMRASVTMLSSNPFLQSPSTKWWSGVPPLSNDRQDLRKNAVWMHVRNHDANERRK